MKARRLVSARVRFRPGKANKVIRHFDREIRPGDKAVLWVRVSRRHLKQQVAALRAAIEARGAVVVALVSHVGCVYDISKSHGDKNNTVFVEAGCNERTDAATGHQATGAAGLRKRHLA